MLYDNFIWLMNWYNNHCDGSWEHTFGIKISNIDNPGWCITISTQETRLMNKNFPEIFKERSEDDWLACKIENGFFDGCGGNFNFAEVLESFRNFAEGDRVDHNCMKVDAVVNKIIPINMMKDLNLKFNSDDSFLWLIKWYDLHCDGDWEHTFVIAIESLDNPGWCFSIPIEETELEDKIFKEINFERSKDDWLICRVQKGFFMGHCGVFNLVEAIQSFRKWAEEEMVIL